MCMNEHEEFKRNILSFKETCFLQIFWQWVFFFVLFQKKGRGRVVLVG